MLLLYVVQGICELEEMSVLLLYMLQGMVSWRRRLCYYSMVQAAGYLLAGGDGCVITLCSAGYL